MKKIPLILSASLLAYASHTQLPFKTYSSAIKEYKKVLKKDKKAILYTNIYGKYIIKTKIKNIYKQYPNALYSDDEIYQKSYFDILKSSSLNIEKELLTLFKLIAQEVYISKSSRGYILRVEGLDLNNYQEFQKVLRKKFRSTKLKNKNKLPKVAPKISEVSITPIFEPHGITLQMDEDSTLELTKEMLLKNSKASFKQALKVGNLKSSSKDISIKGYKIVPKRDYFGKLKLNYTISNHNQSKLVELNLRIKSINDTPVAKDDILDLTEESSAILDLAKLISNDSDIEGDKLSLIGFKNLKNVTIKPNKRKRLVITPKEGYTGKASFEYIIQDTNKARAEAKVDINILAFTPYTRALKYYNDKKYYKSLEIFNRLFFEDLTNPDLSFYIGLNYIGMGKFDEAIAAYDRVLIIDPSSIRTQLEVAKTHYLMKKYDKSEDEFNDILKQDIPNSVRKNVIAFLDLIDKTKKNHFFNAIVIAGINYDNNVNNYDGDKYTDLKANSDEIVSDLAHQEIAMINYKYRVNDDIYIKNDSMAFNKMMFKVENKNIILLSNTTSLDYTNKKQVFNLGFYYDRLQFGGTWLMHKWAVLPKYSIPINDKIKLATNIKYESRMFLDSAMSTLNTTYYELNSTANITLDAINSYSVGIMGAKEAMNDSTLSGSNNIQYALNGGYSYKYSKKITLDTKLNYKFIKYLDENADGIKRADTQYSPSLNATYLDWGFVFSSNITYMMVASNVDASAYNKITTGITVVKPF